MSISFSNNVDIGGNISGGEVKNQNKTLTANGVYTADAGYTGLGTVTVSVEDAGINIPKSIVSNTLTTSNTVSSHIIPATVTNIGEGVYAYAFINSSVLQSVDASSLENITGSNAFRFAYKGSTIKTADFSSVQSVGTYSVYSTFEDSNIETIDFSSLETVNGNYAFYYFCENTQQLVSVDMSSLTSVTGNYTFVRAFDGSSISKFSSSTAGNAIFPQLTTISGDNTFQYMFTATTNITTVRFPVLNSITDSSTSNSIFYGAFGNSNITKVYFNALTSNSFSGDPFKGMFINNYNSISLHFKNNSALKTKIQGLDSYPRFGAPNSDNVAVFFDL